MVMGATGLESGLVTGDPMVDDQHEALMEMFDELRRAVVEGEGGPAVDGILDRLSEYVMVHFEAERLLMLRTCFDAEAMKEHLAMHDDLTARTREMILRYRAGDLTSIEPLAPFLQEWLSDHIRKTDQALVAHVRSTKDR
jgi:hemerythrin